MKILLLAAVAAALAVVAVGSATAAKPPKGTTISLSQPITTYGSSVKLSGTLANGQAGQQVTVLAREYGQTTFASLTTVTTTSGGAWTYSASPKIQTQYEATWNGATTKPVEAKVRPLLTLRKVTATGTHGTFTVTATGNRVFDGKFVLVQRLRAGAAAAVNKVVLGSSSSATFTIKIQHGKSQLRAVMPTSQTQPGYVAAQSATLVVQT
jgi:opacity protein-like surface antigen